MSLFRHRSLPDFAISQLSFLTSLSLLPLLVLTRSRWNARLGLDPLHLILIQLLLTLFVSQKLASTAVDISSKKSSETETRQDLERIPDKKLEKKTKELLDTPASIVKSLKEIIERPMDWINVFPSPGMEIQQHRTINSLYSVRTEIEDGHVTIEQLTRCIRESKQWEWDRMCECGEDLGNGVTWLRLKSFWPIKSKELIIRSGIFRLAPSESSTTHASDSPSYIKILAGSSSTTHPLKQSSLEIKFSGYLIEQIPSSSGLQVTQIVDLSGFGPLPTFVTKAILKKFIPSSLKKLITLAHQIKPLTTEPHQSGTLPSWMPPLLMDSIGSHSSFIPSSEKVPNDQESLRPIVDELKRITNDLRYQQQRKGEKSGLGLTKNLKLSYLLGTSSLVVFCLSSIFFKNNPALFNRIRNKVLNFYNRNNGFNRKTRLQGNNDDVMILVDFFLKLKE